MFPFKSSILTKNDWLAYILLRKFVTLTAKQTNTYISKLVPTNNLHQASSKLNNINFDMSKKTTVRKQERQRLPRSYILVSYKQIYPDSYVINSGLLWPDFQIRREKIPRFLYSSKFQAKIVDTEPKLISLQHTHMHAHFLGFKI